jgi:hypothetical protein
MRFLRITAALGAAMFLQCTASGPKVEIGGYTFSYRGKDYRIESVTPNYSEGYNLLTSRRDGQLVLKGIDKEQDGELDDLLIGDLTLEEAKATYREGILEGERRGFLRKRTFSREYKTSDALFDYTLSTYVLATGEIYNKLVVESKQTFQGQVVLLDNDADGQIDRIDAGMESPSVYQKIYADVLDKGVKAERIERSGGRYLVYQ